MTPTVLVVEDDEAVRATVVSALRDEGYNVVPAADGAEALDLVARELPCAILLDMRMPVLDGWRFAAAYRQRPGPHAPIVVMTAATNARAWADEIGADALLAKPFDLDALFTIVERVCGPAVD